MYNFFLKALKKKRNYYLVSEIVQEDELEGLKWSNAFRVYLLASIFKISIFTIPDSEN